MTPLVAVLLPNYNNAPYLKEALDSLFAQTFQDFEIIFVDDCSTDDSIKVARSYNDSRLKIFENDQNLGIVGTMNRGLEEIKSKYIIRMDGDDISTPDRFEKLVNFMEKHSEIGVCSSSIQTFGEDTTLLEFEQDPKKNKANLIFGHSIGHASSIFRSGLFFENNLRYEDVFWRMEDYLLFYRLKDLTLTTCIPDVLYLYRKGEYNASHEIMDKKRKEFYRFYQFIFDEMGYKCTDREAKLHVQLSRREEPSEQYELYREHIDRLILTNQKSGIFPADEFRLRLEQALDSLTFKLIDLGKISFRDVFKLNKQRKGLVKYYLRRKLK